jgi:hypothetical protein
MCTAAARCAIASLTIKEERERWMRHFGFKKDLHLAGENAFYHALNLAVPELRTFARTLDKSILSLYKTKATTDRRADYFHFVPIGEEEDTTGGLHGEYDESPDHEDCDVRIDQLYIDSRCSFSYVVRVCGHHACYRESDSDKAVCIRRVRKEYGAHYELTPHGWNVVKKTAAAFRQIIKWIEAGLEPNDADRPRKIRINFEHDIVVVDESAPLKIIYYVLNEQLLNVICGATDDRYC